MFLFWRRWLNQPVLSSKPRVGRRSRARCYRPCIELFEDRVVLSTIYWINPNSGNWQVGSNWSGGAVPGPGDDVIIDVPGNITVTHGSGKDSVQSLTSQQNLALTDGSSLTVTGAFLESGNHTLDVDQASTFLANGTSTINGANLYAANGSLISLPGAASYDAFGVDFSPTIQASGAGSRLDLSHVTTWRGAGSSGNGNRIYVQAYGGAVADLSQLSQIADGNTTFQAYDGGQISLAQLNSFTGALPGGYNALDARRGGSAITASNLTSLTNVDLDLGGNASLPVAALSSFKHGNMYVFNDGNAGGELALPLTTIDEAGNNFSPTFQASGAGSRLDLSQVTTWRGGGDSGNGNRIYVQTFSGAVVDLSQLSQITTGNTWFQAYDGGRISLSQLSSFTGALPGGYNVLDARRGGSAILAPNLTSLTNVDLDLGGNASLPVAALSSFKHGDVYAFNDGNAGGVLALPLTTIDEASNNFSPTFQASGAGSRLDLSHVTTWRGGGDSGNGNRIYVQTFSGAVVDLSQLSQITTGNTWFQAYDGGRISLSQLSSFTGALPGGYNVLDARRGGSAILAPNLTSLTNVDLDLGGNASLPVAALSSFKHGDLYAFNDDNAGGVLALPLTTIDEASNNFSPTFQASGTDSRLDLSHVTTWRGAGDSANGNRIYVQAFGGGVVDLSQLGQIVIGNTWFQAYDGGQISLAQLNSFTGALPGGYNVLDVRRGGTINLNSSTTIVANVIVSVDPTSTITAGTLHLASGSLLTGSGTITASVINDAEVQPEFPTDTLVVTGDYTQNAAGTVTHMGTFTVDGLFTWAGGTITGSGTVNASGGLSISGDSNKTLDGRTLNDSGSGTWTGTGNLIIGDGAILYLFNAAALDIQNDQTITNTLGGSATVDNTGLLRKSAATGTTTIGVPFTNTGTVQVVNGTLRLTGPFSNFSGSTLTGGVYLIGGTFQFPGAAITTNLASILLNGPFAQIVNESGNDALANFTSNGGNFTIENSRNFTSASFNDSGSLTIGPGSTFTVNGTYTETGTLSVQLGGTMTVAGSFTDFSNGTLAGGTYLIGGTFQFPGANIVNNDATLVLTGPASQIVDQANNSALANFAGNDAPGSFTIQNGRNFTTAGAFSNAGSLVIGLGSTLTVTGAFTQTGTLSIENLGTLDLLGGGSANASLSSAGTLVIDAGSTFTLTLPVTLTGTVDIQPGATLSLPGNSNNLGSMNVLGAVTVIGDFSNNGSLQLLTGGSFTVIGAYTQNGGSTSLSNATLSATGLVDVAGGVLSGSGTINASVLNAALVEVGSDNAAGLLTITGNYTQTATGVLNITISGYKPGVDFGQLAIGGTATLGGTLDVSLANGFTPMSGDSFLVLTFASLSGQFATTNLDPSLQTPPTYDATDVLVLAN